MEKPIIATTLSGLFLKKEPWDKAHILWYEKAAEKLKDESVKNWIKRPDYFRGVDEVMQRLYPNLPSGGLKRFDLIPSLFNSLSVSIISVLIVFFETTMH